jgi:predicted ATPase
MLIDLHCHTRNVKQGDGDGREVSDELFTEKIKSSGVEIAAITNHNMIDLDQFQRLKNLVSEDCKLWPGVELDISYGTADDRYHLLVICNPKNLDDFAAAVAEITNGSTPDSYVGNIELIVEKFKKLDCIFLPHYIGKMQSIPDKEYEKLVNLLPNKNRLIAEAANVRSMSIFINHGINAIAGSDIKDWANYPGKDVELPELRLKIDEFEHFCQLLDRDPVVVKSLLDKNKSTPYDVYPNPANRDIKERLSFYKEVNVIFGDKGTGKTEVIRCLSNKLKSEDIPYAEYVSGLTKDYLDDLLDTTDMERSAEILGIDSCEDDFDLVKNWGDRSPTPIMEYIEYFQTRTSKQSEKRIGWSRMSDMMDNADSRLEKITQDSSNIYEGIKYLSELEITRYLDSDDSELLLALLKKLEQSVQQQKKAIAIEKTSVELVNFTLRTFRDYTSAKTGSATRPQDTGFGRFAKNRLALATSINRIVSSFDFKEHKEYMPLGDIGEKGKIEIESRHRMLNDTPVTKSSHKEYGGNITKLQDIKTKILRLKPLVFSLLLDDKLVELKDRLVECEVGSMDEFVGIYKQTVDSDRKPYSPSNGERAIIFIQRALEDQEATVFLLDEPEQSMANSYIDDIIRPRITQLGRQKKTVILATHNANLAVRTLPYTTIYRSHGPKGYATYVGNPFTNQLININDPSDRLDWKETSMRILEGGKEAFYDRGGIYESGR